MGNLGSFSVSFPLLWNLQAGEWKKYPGVKEFHMLARIGYYANLVTSYSPGTFVPLIPVIRLVPVIPHIPVIPLIPTLYLHIHLVPVIPLMPTLYPHINLVPVIPFDTCFTPSIPVIPL